jgi:hypothetical protein
LGREERRRERGTRRREKGWETCAGEDVNRSRRNAEARRVEW